jgi:hypothetical protein
MIPYIVMFDDDACLCSPFGWDPNVLAPWRNWQTQADRSNTAAGFTNRHPGSTPGGATSE